MTIEKIRERIDETDDRIAELLIRRMGLTDEIGRIKARDGALVRDEKRERVVVDRITRGLTERDRDAVARVYERVLEVSRSRQEDLR